MFDPADDGFGTLLGLRDTEVLDFDTDENKLKYPLLASDEKLREQLAVSLNAVPGRGTV